jgi:hypothetical protein
MGITTVVPYGICRSSARVNDVFTVGVLSAEIGGIRLEHFDAQLVCPPEIGVSVYLHGAARYQCSKIAPCRCGKN